MHKAKFIMTYRVITTTNMLHGNNKFIPWVYKRKDRFSGALKKQRGLGRQSTKGRVF